MGAGSSKLKKQVAELEASYIDRERKIIEQRVHDLNGKDEELQSSKKVEDELLKAKKALATQIKELSQEFEFIEKEREKQVSKLKSDLHKKVVEAAEARRSSAAILIDRDNAQTRISVLEKEVQTLKDEANASATQRKDIEAELEKEKQAIKEAQYDLAQIENEKKELAQKAEGTSKSVEDEVAKRVQVEQELEAVKEELAAAKKDHSNIKREKVEADMQLRTTKARLETSKESLATLRKQQEASAAAAEAGTASATQHIQGELNLAHRQLASSREHAAELERELASAKATLDHSETKRNALQRGQNESVTKSAAQHEMITALKMELTDTHRHYKALQAEVQALKASARSDEKMGVTSVTIPVSAGVS